MKDLLHKFPKMKLCFLSAVAHAKVNGTYKVAERGGKYDKTRDRKSIKAGAATIADPILSKTIHQLCCLRSSSPGKLTTLKRKWKEDDDLEARRHRERREEMNIQEKIRLRKIRADKANTNQEVVLFTSKDELHLELLACEGVKSRSVQLLKKQIDGRVDGRNFQYPLSAIGMEFRSSHGKKLRKKPPAGKEEVAYLRELVELMIHHDRSVGQVEVAPALKLTRTLACISSAHTMARSTALKKELLDKLSEGTEARDDPLLLQLTSAYKGRMLYDYERDKITYRIEDIMYVPNKNNPNWPCWEATCVPVQLSPSGEWAVPPEHLVSDSTGATAVKKKSYVGFGLVELVGESETPTPMPWVDLYMARHEAILAAGLYRPQL